MSEGTLPVYATNINTVLIFPMHPRVQGVQSCTADVLVQKSNFSKLFVLILTLHSVRNRLPTPPQAFPSPVSLVS